MKTVRLFRFVWLFTLIFAGLTVPASAQKSPVTAKSALVFPQIKTLTKGRLRLQLGKTQRIIDLSSDISGCLTLYDGSQPKAAKIDVTHFQTVDRVVKERKFYLVLLATAGGNCNIQGGCGAAEDYTLLWLKLNQELEIEKKQAAVINSCHYAGIGTVSPADFGFDEESGEFRQLPLENGVLKVEYEENRYREDRPYKFSSLLYKHAAPEEGFLITVEPKERPQ